MFQRVVFAAVAALCVHAASAESATPAYSPEYGACQAKSGGVDQAMLDCIAAEYALQDKRLNESYKALSAQMAPKQRAALKTSQCDWVRSRKSTCELFYKVGGGTSANLQAQSCHLDALVDRASLVEHWKQLHDASR